MVNSSNVSTNLKQSSFIVLLLCAAASLSISPPAYAQISEFKITASDGAAGDDFGWSVSISGDYAVVGALGHDAGSAYVFKRTGTSWAQEAKLLPSDGAADDHFGSSVSISGYYAVVGAMRHDDNGDDAGSAYIFKRRGTSWAQEAKLLPADGAAYDWFGLSVSISGDYAVVGAMRHDDNGSDAGSAYIFKRFRTIWAEEAKLLASDGAAGDIFGGSVSISGDYAVVGAWGDEYNGEASGSAYVFKRSGTIWAEEAKLLASDGGFWDMFGSSVSISGDYAVVGVGAQRYDVNGNLSGSAYLFKRSGTIWAEEAKLLASDGAAFDSFGSTVSISGDYAVMSAFADDDNGDQSGSAYVYSGFTTVVGVEDEIAGLAAEFALSQNYPNPFNPVTVIEYTLPFQSQVNLIIYNLRGEEVAHLINESISAGNHQVIWDASNVASGIYFYRLQAGDFVLTRKMVLLR